MAETTREAALEAALNMMLDVQSRRRHPLGAPDEGIAYDAAGSAAKGRAALAMPSPTAPRPRSEWHEDFGDALWWCWRDGKWLGESPYVGSPLDCGLPVQLTIAGANAETTTFYVGGWPGYHTHWTPIPLPREPKQ